ncbi:MAG: hypothetical protein KDI51_15815, partial [Xanthomonadales bacterium]|nr:hypothetical protein [Xanthomonadales bacterium]
AQTLEALDRLQQPDQFSRTPDHEGRRIAVVEGGWVLLNYATYRQKASQEEAREKAAKRKQLQREREAAAVTRSHAMSRDVTHVPRSHDIASPSPSPSLEEDASDGADRADPDRFDVFWAAYPRKENKKKAVAVWKSRRLDRLADQIITDVRARSSRHRPWRERVIPHAETYLRNDRWEDEIDESSPRESPGQREESRGGRDAPMVPFFEELQLGRSK